MLPLLYPRHSSCSHGNQQTVISLQKKKENKRYIAICSKEIISRAFNLLPIYSPLKEKSNDEAPKIMCSLEYTASS